MLEAENDVGPERLWRHPQDPEVYGHPVSDCVDEILDPLFERDPVIP